MMHGKVTRCNNALMRSVHPWSKVVCLDPERRLPVFVPARVAA